MNIVQNLPAPIPGDMKWCFFLIARNSWKGRVRMPYKRAKVLARLQDTEVVYDDNQIFPDVGECRTGTQKALVFGTRKGKKKND